MKLPLKVSYNSPVMLTFAIICTIVYLMNTMTNQALNAIFALSPNFYFNSVSSYLSLLLYIFGHADANHLLGNMMFILLLGPIMEEKYGSRQLIIMIIVTAFVTGVFNILLFSTGILGASGIVFMLIILVSFTNVEKGKIPLTFILILFLYIGKEIAALFENDNISQFAHVFGGICGSVFGFLSFKNTSVKKINTESVDA